MWRQGNERVESWPLHSVQHSLPDGAAVCPVCRSLQPSRRDAGQLSPGLQDRPRLRENHRRRESSARARWARSIGHGSFTPKRAARQEPAVPLALKQLNPRAMVQRRCARFSRTKPKPCGSWRIPTSCGSRALHVESHRAGGIRFDRRSVARAVVVAHHTADSWRWSWSTATRSKP